MRLVFAVVVLSFCFNLSAQSKNGNNWVLGSLVEIPDFVHGTLIDFNDPDSIVVSPFTKDMDMFVTNSSMSNSDGDLIFYSNGCFIENKENEVLLGGESILPGQFTDSGSCEVSGYTIINATVSLPAPCHEDLYYVFNLDFFRDLLDPDGSIVSTGLLYNVIDIDRDGGNGEVIVNNEFAFQDTLKIGAIAATRHANGRDWWIVVQEFSSGGCFYSVLLNENGLQEPVKSCTGFSWVSGTGVAKFSPDGDYYALSNFQNGLNVFYFDNSSGVLKLKETVEFVDEYFPRHGGLSISPNSKFVYISAGDKLFQYQIDASIVADTKELVAVWDGTFNPQSTRFSLSALAPDGRIYIATPASSYSLSVIEDPDKKGTACNVNQHSLELPVNNSTSVPNNPYYGAEPDNSPCDSLLALSFIDETELVMPHITIFPNPALDEIVIEFDLDIKIESLLIRDVTGQVLDRKYYSGQILRTIDLDISALPPGTYISSIQTGNGSENIKFIKM